MNTENFNRLIERVAAQETRINFGSWYSCYTGMAWELEGKPGWSPTLFDFGDWLGIDESRAEKLQYLYDFGRRPGRRIEDFNNLDLDAQKRVLIRGLESLRDTGEIVWE